jgi:hypothetical protein
MNRHTMNRHTMNRKSEVRVGCGFDDPVEVPEESETYEAQTWSTRWLWLPRPGRALKVKSRLRAGYYDDGSWD